MSDRGSMTFYELCDHHGKVSHSDICNQFLLLLLFLWMGFFFANRKPSFFAGVVLGRCC